jgi:hypothetical protein
MTDEPPPNGFDPDSLEFEPTTAPGVKPDPDASRDVPFDESPPPRNWRTRTNTRGKRTTKTDAKAPSWDITRKVIPNQRGQFVDPLMKLYASVGAGLMVVDPICGTAIVTSAEQCARSLDELAYQNESVRRALYSLTTTSYVGAVLIAHMPIMMAVAMHHIPAAQQAFGQLGAKMMEEYAKQAGQNTDKGSTLYSAGT